jgi:hypothetical protein
MRAICPLDRELSLGLVHRFGQLFADNGELGRCFDPDTHAAVSELDHGDGDLVANENAFADFSTEYQHKKALILGFWAVGVEFSLAIAGGAGK